jgi:hypothetical protein
MTHPPRTMRFKRKTPGPFGGLSAPLPVGPQHTPQEVS